MKHFLTTEDWSQAQLQQMINAARKLKAAPCNDKMQGKSVALLFLNPSMRTRASFDIGIQQMGGIAVVLQPGKDAWGIEFNPNVIMNDEAEEHIAEVAGVLSRYCDMLAIRAFPQFKDWSVDKTDHIIKGLAKYSSVPVVNMETIIHPCQELAMMMALQERIGEVKNKKAVVTWTMHPKPLNMAVANSAVLMTSKFGMDVTLLCPNENYLLDAHYIQSAEQFAKTSGGSFNITFDIEEAYTDADFIYAKSWGALGFYGNPDAEIAHRQQYKHFIVDEAKMAMTNDAVFSHCLPLRRNIKATDAVMDAPYCMAIDEAENRLHAQKAMMLTLLNGDAT